MLLRGCFVAAKKVAVALDTLIRTQFPHDDLSVIGFAYYARELRPEALAELTWHGYEYGTNLQHGLMLARRILDRQRGGNRQIVVITDGEPTAHFENGQVEFSYPPTRRTIQETLREVQRCTRDGITINTFMLERSRALAEFVALVTRLNRGRAFYATPEHLGEYVLVDFVSRRTQARSGADASPEAAASGSAPERRGCPVGPAARRPDGVAGPARSGGRWMSRCSPCSCSCTSWARSPCSGRRSSFPLIASQAQKTPQNGPFAAALSEPIERRIVIPGAIVQGITGVGLIIILAARIDLTSAPTAGSSSGSSCT